jgi:PAS domain S-box-containing protein/putative nucleotidyltransferase with HDIG domain
MQGLSRNLGFEALAESLPHAVWVKGPDGAMEYVNAKYTEFVGQAGAGALGWAWLDLVHPEDLAEARAAFERARADGAAYQTDLRVRAANGAYRWVASRGAPMRGPDGAILAWVGTVTDIDDQKGQERRLRRSQRELAATAALLDALQTAAPVGLAFVDRQFRKLRVNEALAKMAGLPIEDQIGRPAAEITPDLWPQLEPVYRLVLSTGKPVLDVEFTRANAAVQGGSSHCLSSFYPVRVDTEVVGVGVVVVDITERRRVEGLLAANLDALVHTIATTVEVRDPYTAGHQTRVARLAAAIAEELGLGAFEVQGIATAAGIHDIGKVGVPAEILSKPGRLSPAEFEIIKQHSQQGHDIVARIAFPWPVAQMILQHHERLDGSGYPGGLSGDQILAGACIIAVADVVEAMSSHRPYRPAIGTEAALAEIELQRGKQLDDDAVNACTRVFREQAFDINWQAAASDTHS